MLHTPFKGNTIGSTKDDNNNSATGKGTTHKSHVSSKVFVVRTTQLGGVVIVVCRVANRHHFIDANAMRAGGVYVMQLVSYRE